MRSDPATDLTTGTYPGRGDHGKSRISHMTNVTVDRSLDLSTRSDGPPVGRAPADSDRSGRPRHGHGTRSGDGTGGQAFRPDPEIRAIRAQDRTSGGKA